MMKMDQYFFILCSYCHFGHRSLNSLMLLLSNVDVTHIVDCCNTCKSPCLTLHMLTLCHSWLSSHDYSFIITWHSTLCLLLISPLQVFWPTIFQLTWDENFRIRILKLIPSAFICEERYQKISVHKITQNWLFWHVGLNKSFSLFSFSLFHFFFFSLFFFYLLVNKVSSF